MSSVVGQLTRLFADSNERLGWFLLGGSLGNVQFHWSVFILKCEASVQELGTFCYLIARL